MYIDPMNTNEWMSNYRTEAIAFYTDWLTNNPSGPRSTRRFMEQAIRKLNKEEGR